MEIEYQLSKKDYIKFSQLYIKDVLARRSWVLIVVAVCLIFPLSGPTVIWWRFLLAVIISPIIVLLVFYGIPFLISLIQLNKLLQEDSSKLTKRTLVVAENGLIIKSEKETITLNWESIALAQSNEKFIYLILVDKKVIPIPKGAFSSEIEAVNFLGLLQNKFIITRGIPRFPPAFINKKPSYLLGLLCLIPAVGAVAGIVFIINGIGRYKDKWFVAIGTTGVLITIGVFTLLAYSTNGFGFKTLLVEQSQRELNSVMKAVEFYKIKNGNYPDSLAQINNDNSEIWIYDPLQSGERAGKSNEFNYEKVDDQYYLFSSGIDGIPNTSDDIYPQVAYSDRFKFGLIRKLY